VVERNREGDRRSAQSMTMSGSILPWIFLPLAVWQSASTEY
jgi:hypothetical protein